MILPAGSQTNSIINNEDDYDIILISGGTNRIIDIKLSQPAIIIIESGNKTIVNVTGGMALPISQAVFIGGSDNAINGLSTQNKGTLVSSDGEEFKLAEIASFPKIVIGK